MKKQFLFPLAAISASLLAGTTAQAATIVTPVDPLDQDQNAYINVPAPGVPDVTNPADVVVSGGILDGVSRSMTLDVITDAGNFSQSAIPAGVGDGLQLSNGVGMATDVTIDYGTFGPLDFTGGAADRFIVGVFSNDLGADDGINNFARITVSDSDSSFTISGEPPTSGLPTDLELLYSDFVGIDFTDVTSLLLELDASLEGDMALNIFALGTDNPPTTPEPATMLGLLAVGAMGFSSRRRRQK